MTSCLGQNSFPFRFWASLETSWQCTSIGQSWENPLDIRGWVGWLVCFQTMRVFWHPQCVSMSLLSKAPANGDDPSLNWVKSVCYEAVVSYERWYLPVVPFMETCRLVQPPAGRRPPGTKGRTFFSQRYFVFDCLQSWEDISVSFIRITCFELFSMILMYLGTSVTFLFKW